MKITMFIFLLYTAAAVFAQTGADPVLQTEHFEIYGNPDNAEALARQMESRFGLYNSIFRLDLNNAELPLRVNVFTDIAQYENYVQIHLGEARPGAVYLHYNQKERRELVYCPSSDQANALAYQSFVQFLRAFAENPPAWIQEGFAVLFATLHFDHDGELRYGENLAWLATVKSMETLPRPEAIMRADTQAIPKYFQGLAWSFVSFLLNSGNDNYARVLGESFMLLSKTGTQAENTETVANRIITWNDMDAMAEDYRNYINARKSFAEIIQEGQDAYAGGRPHDAEAAFRGAMELRPAHYAPWYYLGLLAYNSGDNAKADACYRTALEYGADRALVLYAQGLNAATAGGADDAIQFLRQAAEADPGRYQEKAEALILRLEKE